MNSKEVSKVTHCKLFLFLCFIHLFIYLFIYLFISSQCNVLVEVRDFKHAQSVKTTLECHYSDVIWNTPSNQSSHKICYL